MQNNLFNQKISKPEKFNYSMFAIYAECPFRYKLIYRDKISSSKKQRYYIMMGWILHQVMHEIFSFNLEQRNIKSMKQILSSKWISWNTDQDKEEQCFQLCEDYLENFCSNYDLNSNVVIREFSIKESYKRDILSGKIDRIDKLNDGTFEIIEYKLGDENKKNLEEIKKDLQWYIYWYLFKKKFPGFKPTLVTFYFLESNRKVSFNPEIKDERNAEIRLTNKIEEIKNDKVFIQKPGKYCNNCYFLNKECRPRGNDGRS